MTKGTYISTSLTPKSTDLILKHLKESGISGLLEAGKHHMTLLYAREAFIPRKQDTSTQFFARVTDYKILGEGEWQGLVMELKCGKAHTYHNGIIKKHGAIHSYPELNTHITVKYRPETDDLQKLKDAIPKNTLLEFKGILMEDIGE